MQSQLPEAGPAVAATRRKGRTGWWLPWAVAALFAAVAAVAVLLPRSTVDAPPIRLDLPLAEQMRLDWFDGPQVSPDGRFVAFAAVVDGRRQLWATNLGSRQATVLPATDGAMRPFWAPDSRSLGFFAGGLLKRVAVDGGQPRILSPLPATPTTRGGTWGPGFILFTVDGTTIHRVPDTGGKPDQLEMPPASGYAVPHLLPDGRAFVVWERIRQQLQVVSLEAPGNPKTIETGVSSGAQYAAGHLLYRQANTLGARPFDVRRLEFSGPFVPLAESATGFSVADRGTIVFRSDPPRPRQLTWLDRNGTRTGTVAESGQIAGLGLAASGRRAAIWRNTGENLDLWNVDLTSGITSRLTTDPAMDADGVWSPDDRMLAFTSQRSGRSAVYLKHLVDGKEELLAELDTPLAVDTWTPDGKAVVARTYGRAVYLVGVTGDRKPRLLVDTPYVEDELHVSPDGRLVAFNSDESGRWEVYVTRFPDFTSKRQVSAAGGVQAHWRGDGKELFFLALNGSMMSVRITPGPELVADPPVLLFTTNLDPVSDVPQYGVTPDGKRFLALDAGDHPGHTFTFLLNVLKPGGVVPR